MLKIDLDALMEKMCEGCTPQVANEKKVLYASMVYSGQLYKQAESELRRAYEITNRNPDECEKFQMVMADLTVFRSQYNLDDKEIKGMSENKHERIRPQKNYTYNKEKLTKQIHQNLPKSLEKLIIKTNRIL